MIPPSKQPAESCANKGRNKPVPVLVSLDHPDRFLFAQKPVRRTKMPRSHVHLFAGSRLNVAKPVRMGEAADHDYLRSLIAILDNFQKCLAPQACAAAGVRQHQQAFPQQPTQSPAVKVYG